MALLGPRQYISGSISDIPVMFSKDLERLSTSRKGVR
jgi:hypothetical protein